MNPAPSVAYPHPEAGSGVSSDRVRLGLRIKKIPPELRIKRKQYLTAPTWYARIVQRLREDSQFFRSTVQLAFLILCLWIGVEFYLFMQWGSSTGQASYVNRPPGAEGFLPISALISLKYWYLTGIVNDIHPAGLFIFISIVAIGLLLKKAFCSWLCPIGTISESLWLLGRKIVGRNLQISRWFDYPLRSLKYILAFFFIYAVSQMDAGSLKSFIVSPYNRVADIKMYLFFARIGSFALWCMIIIMVLSIFVKSFWCRYLCPYGAFLGSLSLLSPFKIRRNQSTCIDCELCTKACPANINVHQLNKVRSDECSGCLECVAVCPVKETLVMRLPKGSNQMPTWVFGSLVVGVFVAITGLAMLTGKWQNSISKEEYLKRMQNIDSPIYEHFGGNAPEDSPND